MPKDCFKKLLCLVLSIMTIMSMGISIFAAEMANTNLIPSPKNTTSFTSAPFFYNEENSEPFAFDDIEFQFEESKTQDTLSTADVSIEIYLLRGGLKKTSSGVFTWWFNMI